VTPLSIPLIYAHRGASFDHPEASREAYLAAVDQGADGFETDLRLTKDGVIVCWHDDDMKRVADCDLVIADSTLEEIRAAYPILTLADLLEIALQFKKHLALETKHPVPTRGGVERELLKSLRTYQDRISEAGISVSIMSFSWLAVARLRSSNWNTVYLIPYRWVAFFNPGRSIGPSVDTLAKLHQSKMSHRKIFAWTANSEEEILLCRKHGANVMMTDRPAFARSILESA